jgi:centrosomal CEP192-like protein
VRSPRIAVTLTALMLVLAPMMPGTARAGAPPPTAFSPTFWVTAIHAGTSATKEFTLTNTGGNATGALTLTIFPSGPFTISADGCTGVSLGPDKSCKVTVQYAPVTAGTDRAGLTAASKKGGFAGVSLTGVSWLTGAEACDRLGGVYGTDDQVDYYNDRTVNWTCNDWVATSDAGPLLSRACQFTPPGTTAFAILIVAEIGDATCYGPIF